MTENHTQVCNIRLATNRQWKTETGERQEQTEYHTVILWGKLAEIANQYLHKGEKAYFQGRLQTRSFTGKDGVPKSATEIIAEDMLMLSGGRIQEGALPASVELRQVKYLNNLIEQDHRFLKRLVKPGLGFFSFQTAWRTLQGYEVMNMLRKGQVRGVGKGDITGQVTFVASLFGGAA